MPMSDWDPGLAYDPASGMPLDPQETNRNISQVKRLPGLAGQGIAGALRWMFDAGIWDRPPASPLEAPKPSPAMDKKNTQPATTGGRSNVTPHQGTQDNPDHETTMADLAKSGVHRAQVFDPDVSGKTVDVPNKEDPPITNLGKPPGEPPAAATSPMPTESPYAQTMTFLKDIIKDPSWGLGRDYVAETRKLYPPPQEPQPVQMNPWLGAAILAPAVVGALSRQGLGGFSGSAAALEGLLGGQALRRQQYETGLAAYQQNFPKAVEQAEAQGTRRAQVLLPAVVQAMHDTTRQQIAKMQNDTRLAAQEWNRYQREWFLNLQGLKIQQSAVAQREKQLQDRAERIRWQMESAARAENVASATQFRLELIKIDRERIAVARQRITDQRAEFEEAIQAKDIDSVARALNAFQNEVSFTGGMMGMETDPELQASQAEILRTIEQQLPGMNAKLAKLAQEILNRPAPTAPTGAPTTSPGGTPGAGRPTPPAVDSSKLPSGKGWKDPQGYIWIPDGKGGFLPDPIPPK